MTEIQSRKSLERVVHSAVRKHASLIALYGSFSRGAFHLDRKSNLSYSDVDTYCLKECSIEERRRIAFDISSAIRSETGLELRVSVRASRFDKELDEQQSFLFSKFDTLLKVSKNPEEDHLLYQSARFLLHACCGPLYFDHPFSISNLSRTRLPQRLLDILFHVKRGTSTNMSASDFVDVLDSTLKGHQAISAHVLTIFSREAHSSALGEVACHGERELTAGSEAFLDMSEKYRGVITHVAQQWYPYSSTCLKMVPAQV